MQMELAGLAGLGVEGSCSLGWSGVSSLVGERQLCTYKPVGRIDDQTTNRVSVKGGGRVEGGGMIADVILCMLCCVVVLVCPLTGRRRRRRR